MSVALSGDPVGCGFTFNPNFVTIFVFGDFTMSHHELGKAVFIAAVIVAKPSIAQSPATNQTAMTFAVENRAIRLSAAVNGVPVRFLVDTGATMVAFPRAAARKLGMRLKSPSLNATASTAAGTKYPITYFRLKRLEIGSCLLTDVEAILVGGPMPEPLLGMSALLRMKLEMSDGKMSLSCSVDDVRPTVAPSSVASQREPTRRH
jgi:clan AA aspartic protease (TIGR02281 family)